MSNIASNPFSQIGSLFPKDGETHFEIENDKFVVKEGKATSETAEKVINLVERLQTADLTPYLKAIPPDALKRLETETGIKKEIQPIITKWLLQQQGFEESKIPRLIEIYEKIGPSLDPYPELKQFYLDLIYDAEKVGHLEITDKLVGVPKNDRLQNFVKILSYAQNMKGNFPKKWAMIHYMKEMQDPKIIDTFLPYFSKIFKGYSYNTPKDLPRNTWSPHLNIVLAGGKVNLERLESLYKDVFKIIKGNETFAVKMAIFNKMYLISHFTEDRLTDLKKLNINELYENWSQIENSVTVMANIRSGYPGITDFVMKHEWKDWDLAVRTYLTMTHWRIAHPGPSAGLVYSIPIENWSEANIELDNSNPNDYMDVFSKYILEPKLG